MKPKIALIGPSHRTHLWKNFYESIITDLDFEVIFVSDIIPDANDLPQPPVDNFNWFISPVKPAQCFEIAYRSAVKRGANFIVWTGDDFVYAPYALDHAYAMYRSFHDHKVMVSFDVYEDGYEATKFYHQLPWDEKVQLTTSALISVQAIEEVGGLADKCFVCGHFDVDLQMRIYANGGRLFVCPTAVAYEPHNQFHKKEANFATTRREELNYFTSLWCKDGVTTWQRQQPFMPYTDDNLLTVSQGPSGKW